MLIRWWNVQESVVFAEARVPQEAWAVLDKLDERIALKWIMPGEGGYVCLPPLLPYV